MPIQHMYNELSILKWLKIQYRNTFSRSLRLLTVIGSSIWITYYFISVIGLFNNCVITEKFDQLYHTSSAICWDQWFPEAARAMALQGAELLFYPTAIGSEPQDDGLDSRDHWKRVMQGHAGANLVRWIIEKIIGSSSFFEVVQML